MSPVPAGLLSEAHLSTYTANAAKLGGFDLAYHTHRSQYSPAGFPDWVFIHRPSGLAVVAELKGYDSRGRLGAATDDQLDWLAGWRAAGVAAYLWAPEDRDLIDQVLVHRRITRPLPELPAPTGRRRRRR